MFEGIATFLKKQAKNSTAKEEAEEVRLSWIRNALIAIDRAVFLRAISEIVIKKPQGYEDQLKKLLNNMHLQST